MIVDNFSRELLDLLAPARCYWCRRAEPGAAPVACASCAAALPWNTHACRACGIPLAAEGARVCGDCLCDSPPQDRTWAAFRYEAPIA